MALPPKRKKGCFTATCISANLHESWSIDEGTLINSCHVARKVRDKLLELCGKAQTKNSHKNRPEKYCKNCLDKIAELYPDLFPEKPSPNDHGYSKAATSDHQEKYICLFFLTRQHILMTQILNSI